MSPDNHIKGFDRGKTLGCKYNSCAPTPKLLRLHFGYEHRHESGQPAYLSFVITTSGCNHSFKHKLGILWKDGYFIKVYFEAFISAFLI